MRSNFKGPMMIACFLVLSAAFSWAGGKTAVSNKNFSEVQGKNWNLMEVRIGSSVIKIDRTDIPMDIYTIKFEPDRFGGRGAPNRFFSWYTVEEGNTITIGKMASTRMIPLDEMENFTEYEYFMYLEKVNRWYYNNGNLELYISVENDNQVTLIFINN